MMLLLIKCALGYDMSPRARPVILPVTAPRNRAREYLSKLCRSTNLQLTC